LAPSALAPPGLVGTPVRRLAGWFLAMPAPDPELQCELMCLVMGLIVLADVMAWWSLLWTHSRFIRF
jgi:hypothetical protein